MRRGLIISIILFVVLVIGIAILVISLNQPAKVASCGTDIGCFIDSINEGKSSNAVYNTILANMFGTNAYTNYMMVNCTKEYCSLFIKNINISSNYLSPNLIAQDPIAYKNGTCLFKKENLVQILKILKEDNFSMDYEDFSSIFKIEYKENRTCKGAYFGGSRITYTVSNTEGNCAENKDCHLNCTSCVSPNGVCIWGEGWRKCVECMTSRDCLSGSFCINDTCEKRDSCESQVDCKASEYCNSYEEYCKTRLIEGETDCISTVIKTGTPSYSQQDICMPGLKCDEQTQTCVKI